MKHQMLNYCQWKHTRFLSYSRIAAFSNMHMSLVNSQLNTCKLHSSYIPLIEIEMSVCGWSRYKAQLDARHSDRATNRISHSLTPRLCCRSLQRRLRHWCYADIYSTRLLTTFTFSHSHVWNDEILKAINNLQLPIHRDGRLLSHVTISSVGACRTLRRMSAYLVRRRSVGNLTPDFGRGEAGVDMGNRQKNKQLNEEKSTECFMFDGKSINR
jgi:hypothetical protein